MDSSKQSINNLETYEDKDGFSRREQQEVFLRALELGYIKTQYSKDGKLYLNPNGSVRRSEVVSILNDSSNIEDSLDDVSKESDFYNSGYNRLVEDEVSNFYGVYNREDLDGAVRRLELAYILAHFYDFADDLFDAETFTDYLYGLYDYKDIRNIELETPIDIELSELLPNRYDSIEDYFKDTKTGVVRLPITSVLLSSRLNQFYINKDELAPISEVSRLDFALVLRGLDIL